MKGKIFTALVCVAAAAVIVGFIMPWATVATSATGVAKGLTGALKDTPYASKIVGKVQEATDAISDLGDITVKSTVKGYQIPIMVNDKTSKVAISLAQIFFPEAQDLDKKSYLVYLFPILGVVCAILAFLGRRNKLYILLMIVISGAVAIGGLYKLHTTDVSNLMVRISIQDGLWYIMYSFLFIALVGVVDFVVNKKSA